MAWLDGVYRFISDAEPNGLTKTPVYVSNDMCRRGGVSESASVATI